MVKKQMKKPADITLKSIDASLKRFGNIRTWLCIACLGIISIILIVYSITWETKRKNWVPSEAEVISSDCKQKKKGVICNTEIEFSDISGEKYKNTISTEDLVEEDNMEIWFDPDNPDVVEDLKTSGTGEMLVIIGIILIIIVLIVYLLKNNEWFKRIQGVLLWRDIIKIF